MFVEIGKLLIEILQVAILRDWRNQFSKMTFVRFTRIQSLNGPSLQISPIYPHLLWIGRSTSLPAE